MKPAALRRLTAEWDKRLARAGFQDLEGADRDGPLSDRGNLHAVEESADADARLEERVEFGSAYHSWAQDVLRQLNGHDARSRLRRRIWAMHADGASLKEIGREIRGVNFHIARDTVRAIKEKYECRKDADARLLVRGVSTTVLKTLATKLIAAKTMEAIRAGGFRRRHPETPSMPTQAPRSTKTPTASSTQLCGA